MVYSGKPSTGCRTCRKRRIKCDEGRPTCAQCIKSHRECLGYPDTADLMFQDQTTQTIKRAHQAFARRRRAEGSDSTSSHDSSDSSSNSSNSSDSPTELVLFDTPNQSIEVAALNFYIDGMILSNVAEGHSIGHLELLPKMFLQSSTDSALTLATTTAGLAALGKLGRFASDGTKIGSLAMEYYGKTVRALGTAIRSPVDRRNNETLMAAILMVVVESLIARDVAPFLQWRSHIHGAVMLAQARGEEIFDDPVALRLYYAARKFIMNGARLNGEHIHPFFADGPPADPSMLDSPGYKLSLITNQVHPLRARVVEMINTANTIEEYAQLSALSDQCQMLEDELEAWANNLPEHYKYDVPAKIESAHYVQQPHNYRYAHVHRVWNSYRCNRLFLNVLVSRCTAKLLEGIEEVSEIYNTTLQQLADDICSSVPSQISDETAIATTGESTRKMSTIQEAFNAFYMLWPLYVAMNIPGLPSSQREWIRKAILEISLKYRIREGMVMVALADKDRDRPLMMNNWAKDLVDFVWENSFIYGAGGV